MRIISGIFSFLFFLAGLGSLAMGCLNAFGTNLAGASAIQITQVYTQAVFFAVLGVGLLLAATVVTLAMLGDGIHELRQAQPPKPQ